MNAVTDTPDHSAPDAAPEHPPRRRWRGGLLAATLTAAVLAVGAVAVTGGTDDDPANPKSSGTHEGMVTGTVWVANVGHGDSQGMPGMMDETEMTTLEQADGENPDAVALAEQIETDQKFETANMDELLGS